MTDTANDTGAGDPKTPQRSLADRVVKASGSIFVAHLMAKAMGLVQARIIGEYYGFGAVNDVFGFAFTGVIWSLFLIGEESLGPAFLPVFMEAKKKDSERAAWRFTSLLLNLQILILFAVVTLLMLFPTQTIDWFTRFNPKDVEKVGELNRFQLANYFLVWMAPSLIGLSIGSLTYMVLNGYKKFFWPAFADAALKIALVLGIVVGRRAGLDEAALVIGVLAAGMTKLLVHLCALRGKLGLYQFTMDLRDPHFKKLCILIAPLLIGILYAKARDYFNDVYVISSLKTGLLSANLYGKKIFTTLGYLVPYSVSIAMFPFLCELVDRKDLNALADFLTRAARMLLMVFFPITVVFMLLSTPLAQVLFQTGKVTAEDAVLVGHINACYILVLPLYALEYVFMQAYFSTRRTVAVTIIGMVFSTLSMGVSYFGVLVYGLQGAAAVMLVALGYTLSRWLKTLTLIGVLKIGGLRVLPFVPTIVFMFRVLLLTTICAAATQGSLMVIDRVLPAEEKSAPDDDHSGQTQIVPVPVPDMKGKQNGGKEIEESDASNTAKPKEKKPSTMRVLVRAAPRLVIPGVAGAIAFFIGCWALKFSELREMLGFAKEKLRRRKERAKGTPQTE